MININKENNLSIFLHSTIQENMDIERTRNNYDRLQKNAKCFILKYDVAVPTSTDPTLLLIVIELKETCPL